MQYDAGSGMERLSEFWVSKASANQRKGPDFLIFLIFFVSIRNVSALELSIEIILNLAGFSMNVSYSPTPSILSHSFYS